LPEVSDGVGQTNVDTDDTAPGTPFVPHTGGRGFREGEKDDQHEDRDFFSTHGGLSRPAATRREHATDIVGATCLAGDMHSLHAMDRSDTRDRIPP
jgi:hypothetical protein